MSLINKRAVRKLAMTIANEKYANKPPLTTAVDSTGRQWSYERALSLSTRKKYTQVSEEFFEMIEESVRNTIQDHLAKEPPIGKTIK